jgi:hypothetical protein
MVVNVRTRRLVKNITALAYVSNNMPKLGDTLLIHIMPAMLD